MQLPIIITNFKTYETGTGSKALELAKIHAKVAADLKVSMAIAVQPTDLVTLVASVGFPVFSQHMDPVSYGSSTGHILPEAIKGAGAAGTLLNHSERRIPMDQIRASIERAKEVSLFTIVCAADDEEAAEIAAMGPDMIAVEPPELIGGDISVSTSDPDLIKRSAEVVGEGRLLVGAGVKTGEDVRIAVELGAAGVLLASGVTKAADPEAVLRDLASGL
ncbi:MAG: triose-phosphate isomerase [Patescibacteria group bacterium]|nr:triose-phosphate isomerase [Patescibacteria group bacterium]